MTNQRQIQNVSIDQLRFDPLNPRLPTTIDRSNTKQILEWMLTEGNIPELMASIGASGYFPGELLFVIHTKRKDVYEVVEGNRRLAAVKLLNDPGLAPLRNRAVLTVSTEAKHKPKELPVIIYDSRKELLDFLAYRHITGVKPWEPLAKARYLGQLFDEVKTSKTTIEEKYRTLARIIGSRSDYVKRLLTGLWLAKQQSSSAERWRQTLTLKSPPITLSFIPFCYRRPQGDWYASHEVVSVLIDRLRLVNIIGHVVKNVSKYESFRTITKLLAKPEPLI